MTTARIERSSRTDDWSVYNFAVLRVVPHVFVGAYVPVGVIVHSPTRSFLGMRVVTDAAVLARALPELDTELLVRYLQACHAICVGNPEGGPLALRAPSERFHWLTAPRSDVIQSSPVHEGLCDDPAVALDELFAAYVRAES